METQKVLVYRRKVKHPRIELKTGDLVLILPKNKNINADSIIEKHSLWINKKLKFISGIKEEFKNKKLIIRKEDDFIAIATDLTDKYSHKLKVRLCKIKFRYMKTRWGSCSSKGNLNFNYHLIKMPKEILEYVVIHEVCHLKHLNHSKEYWGLVESLCTDYKARVKWVKENGGGFIG